VSVILIFGLLFAFWAEQALGFKLTEIRGLSLLNLFIYLLILAWAVNFVRKRHQSKSNGISKYLIVLIAIVSLSAVWKVYLQEVPIRDNFQELASLKDWATPILLFLVVFSILGSERDCLKIIYGLEALVIVSTATMLLVSFGVLRFGVLKVVLQGRSAGFAEPNQYATFLVLFIPLLAMQLIKGEGVKRKAFAFSICILALVGIIATGSRGGILSLFFSILVYLALMYRHRVLAFPVLVFVICGMVILGGVSIIVAPSKVGTAAVQKLDPTQAKDLMNYTSGRTTLWRQGLQLFFERPLLGHGHDTFVPLSKSRFPMWGNSHNEYLLYLVNYGIIGFLIFLIIFYKIYRYTSQQLAGTSDPAKQQLLISYLAGLAGFVSCMFGVNVMVINYPFWIYTAAIFKYCQYRE
jgi:O-antigen ligase